MLLCWARDVPGAAADPRRRSSGWLPLERPSSWWLAGRCASTREGVAVRRARSPPSSPARRAPSPWSGVAPRHRRRGAAPSSTSAPTRWSTTPTGSRATAHAVAEVHRLFHVACRASPASSGSDGMAMMTDRPDQVAPLKAALEARRDAAPAGHEALQGRARAPGLRPRPTRRRRSRSCCSSRTRILKAARGRV